MKSFIFIVIAITFTSAQRPSFAGSSPKGYSLASRFQDNTAEVSTSSSVANRFDDTTNNNAGTNQNLPVDARGDVDLVNRLNQWPREKRPFWLLNAAAIERQRDPEGIRTGLTNTPISSTNQQNVASLVNRFSSSDSSVFTNEVGDILVPVDDENQLKNILSKGSAKVFVLVPNNNSQNSQNILSRSSVSTQSTGYGR